MCLLFLTIFDVYLVFLRISSCWTFASSSRPTRIPSSIIREFKDGSTVKLTKAAEQYFLTSVSSKVLNLMIAAMQPSLTILVSCPCSRVNYSFQENEWTIKV